MDNNAMTRQDDSLWLWIKKLTQSGTVKRGDNCSFCSSTIVYLKGRFWVSSRSPARENPSEHAVNSLPRRLSPAGTVTALQLQRQPCCYSYSPVTVTALQLQRQPCCYSYSPAVTEAALLLQLQPCSYRGSPAVTVTALQLQRQPCCYSYSPAVTVTAVQLQLQPCSVPAPCLRHQAVGVRHFINLPGPHQNTSS